MTTTLKCFSYNSNENIKSKNKNWGSEVTYGRCRGRSGSSWRRPAWLCRGSWARRTACRRSTPALYCAARSDSPASDSAIYSAETPAPETHTHTHISCCAHSDDLTHSSRGDTHTRGPNRNPLEVHVHAGNDHGHLPRPFEAQNIGLLNTYTHTIRSGQKHSETERNRDTLT